jgi:uncharacterized membrane protein
MDEQWLREAIGWTTRGVEVVGIAVILIGAVIAFIFFLRQPAGRDGRDRIACLRSDLGRSILLGLELLVAADIINTVAIEPTLDSVAVLGAIVLIRTFLSWSLEVEIEGRWPWQAASRPAPAAETERRSASG